MPYSIELACHAAYGGRELQYWLCRRRRRGNAIIQLNSLYHVNKIQP